MEVEILGVLSWILTLKWLQVALWPRLTTTFREHAYPLSFSASILLFTFLSWYCGIVRLPLVVALLPFAALFFWHLWNQKYTWDQLRPHLGWDAVVLTGFLFLLLVRFENPDISFAEKFMDHAFLASIQRAPVVPPLDPWYAGGTLTVYYYLGYWMMGAIGVVSGVPSPITFNLALPTILGLCLVNGLVIGRLFLDRLRALPLLTFFLVPAAFLYYMAQGIPLSSVMWESTRTISNTITEFPLFSFLWGDVHPHVLGLSNQVFFIALLCLVYRCWDSWRSPERMVGIGLCALSLGSMPLLNTWDVMVYAPLFLAFGFLLWYRSRDRSSASRILLLVPAVSVLLYLPYYLTMSTAGIKGVFPVPAPSDPVQFLLVHGFFLLLLMVSVRGEIWRRPYLLLLPLLLVLLGFTAAAIASVPLLYLLAQRRFSPLDVLAIAGLFAILFPEFLYLKDAFGEPYLRMNTVFKFTYAGGVLLGLSSLSLAGTELKAILPAIEPVRTRVLAVLLAILLILSPLVIPLDFGQRGGTLDGMAYLWTDHPGDAKAIWFLRSLEGSPILVEAEKGDYSYYSRVSAFTGIPAIIGWPSHEITWRGSEAEVMQRVSDVRTIYENPDRTLSLMEQYGATLLYVGPLEQERYQVNLPEKGLSPFYENEGVVIYQRELLPR